MRLRLNTFIAPVLTVLLYGANAEPSTGELYPPGYLPLVNKANVLLSAGQFNDAAKAYSEAIGTCISLSHNF
jgi:DnaJ homolog subfamily C member 3